MFEEGIRNIDFWTTRPSLVDAEFDAEPTNLFSM